MPGCVYAVLEMLLRALCIASKHSTNVAIPLVPCPFCVSFLCKRIGSIEPRTGLQLLLSTRISFVGY